MSDSENQGGKKLAIGVAIGAAAGYIAGILTAPKKGKETRETLAKTPAAAKKWTEKEIQERKKQLDELIEQAKSKSSDATAKAKSEATDALTAAKEVSAKAAAVLSALKNGEADNDELDKAIKQLKEAKDHLKTYLKD